MAGTSRLEVGSPEYDGVTPDSLHLAQRNFVLRPVLELGRSGRLVAGHLLAVLQSSVVFSDKL
jgi:hypothetical protein